MTLDQRLSDRTSSKASEWSNKIEALFDTVTLFAINSESGALFAFFSLVMI